VGIGGCSINDAFAIGAGGLLFPREVHRRFWLESVLFNFGWGITYAESCAGGALDAPELHCLHAFSDTGIPPSRVFSL